MGKALRNNDMKTQWRYGSEDGSMRLGEKNNNSYLVSQSSWVVGNKVKVCLEEIQVAVVHILQR